MPKDQWRSDKIRQSCRKAKAKAEARKYRQRTITRTVTKGDRLKVRKSTAENWRVINAKTGFVVTYEARTKRPWFFYKGWQVWPL